jgi:acyl-CoA synthetase (AMP-forming)/AMP-acid ligase II
VGVRSRLATLLNEAPDSVEAVEFDGSWWTWGDLQSVARDLGELLDDAGFGADARIGVVLENRPEHLGVVIALLASGRCLVTLSPLQPPERLAEDIARCAAGVVVGSPEVLAEAQVLGAITDTGLALELGSDGKMRSRGGRSDPEAAPSPNIAVEMLTSGTTGPAKRVRLRDAQLDTAMASSGQTPRDDSLLRSGIGIVATPMVHIGGLWGAVAGLYSGRRIVLLPRFTLEPWLRAVQTHRPRAAGLVPAALRTLLDADVPPEKLAGLQVIICGTTFCPPELAERFFVKYGVRVLMTYGATEFAGAVTAWTLPMHLKWWDTKAGSAGRALAGVQLRVVGPDGSVLGADEVGQLEVRTEQAPQGGAYWVRTSDLGRVDEDGFVWINGRADDAIIRGGFKVQPDQVRAALERHPAVQEAAVAGLPHDRLGQVPVAAVQCHPGSTPPEIPELIALCRQLLTPYEVPVHVLVLGELPRTPSSKVSRVELLDLVRADMAEQGAA